MRQYCCGCNGNVFIVSRYDHCKDISATVKGLQLSTGMGETKLVSGYDKNSPDPKYEPDRGPGGTIVLLALASLIVVGTFGGIFF